MYTYLCNKLLTHIDRVTSFLQINFQKNWEFIIGKWSSYVSQDLYRQLHAIYFVKNFDERNKRAKHMNEHWASSLCHCITHSTLICGLIQWVYVCNSNNSLIRIYWWTTSKTKYTKHLSRKLLCTERSELPMEIARLYRHLCVSRKYRRSDSSHRSIEEINFSAFAKAKVPHLKWISCKLQFVSNLSVATVLTLHYNVNLCTPFVRTKIANGMTNKSFQSKSCK